MVRPLTKRLVLALVGVSAVVPGCTMPSKDLKPPVVEGEVFLTGRKNQDAHEGRVGVLQSGTSKDLTLTNWDGSVRARARATCAQALLSTAETTVELNEAFTTVNLGQGTNTLSLAAAGCDVEIDYLTNLFQPQGFLSVVGESAAEQASRTVDGSDRATLLNIAAVPQAFWVASNEALAHVRSVVSSAAARGERAVLVLYRIPRRDCGGHALDAEALDAEGYRSMLEEFTSQLHRSITSNDATAPIVIIEPDATSLDCADDNSDRERDTLLSEAVHAVAATGALVYLDAGHSRWHSAHDAASRLERAGITAAKGFALNVANFRSQQETIAYGDELSALLAKPYVYDTSRSGGKVDEGEWCNPEKARIGELPSMDPPSPFSDGRLWVKRPGESDGTCNERPEAGIFDVQLALNLARGTYLQG